MLDYAASMDSTREDDALSAPAAAVSSAWPEEEAAARAPLVPEPQDGELASLDLEKESRAEVWDGQAPRVPDADELSESSLSVSEPGAARKHKGTAPPPPDGFAFPLLSKLRSPCLLPALHLVLPSASPTQTPELKG